MAFYAGALGSIAGQAQGKHDAYLDSVKAAAAAQDAAEKKREFDAQQMLAQQQAAAQQAQFATTSAANAASDKNAAAVAQANIAHTQHQDKLDDIANGVGLAPWQPPLNHGVAPTIAQKAELARQEEHYYRSHGASVKADAAAKDAAEYDKTAATRATQAEKVQADANHLIEIMGRVGHWSDETKVAMRRAAMQESALVLRGESEQTARDRIKQQAENVLLTLQNRMAIAKMTVGERAKAASDMNMARAAIAQMQQGSANWREMVGQGLEQVDASGNPVPFDMSQYGGGMGGGSGVNIYLGGQQPQQPQIQPPSVNPQGQPSGGGIQPPQVGGKPPTTQANPPTIQRNGKTYYLNPDGKYYLTPPK